MKPPKLKKLSKKELRELYANQWNQNIILAGKNEKMSKIFDRVMNMKDIGDPTGKVFAVVEVQELEKKNEQIRVSEIALKQVKEHLEASTKMKESLLKIINRIRRGEGEVVSIPEEGELILLTRDEYIGLKNRLMIAKQDLDIAQKALQVNQEDKNKIRQELEDTIEALSRSRQLREWLQKFADSKSEEKNSIEEMTEMLFTIFTNQMGMRLMEYEEWRQEYKDLNEETKDIFRVIVTRILSEKPVKAS